MTVAEHLPGHTLNFRHIFLAENLCWPEVVGDMEKWCWPEVVGWMATPAVQKIAQERPDVAVEVLPLGTRIEPGSNCKRVQVQLDLYGYVSEVPVIG